MTAPRTSFPTRPLSLRSVVAGTGVVLALVCSLIVPAGYAAFEYVARADILAFKARLSADRVAKYVYAHEKLWQYQNERLAELIELPRDALGDVRQRVVDGSGRMVLEEGSVGEGPRLRRSAPITVNGEEIGYLEAETSLTGLWVNVAWVMLFSSTLGFAAYLAFRAVPLRVLDRTLGVLETQNMRFDTALNNMSQGLTMFDARQRLVVCNARYLQIYGLSPAETRPGTTLRQILEHRAKRGAGPQGMEPAEYAAEIAALALSASAWSQDIELVDGRAIVVKYQPMPGGGWVATHEDVTELRRRQEALRAQNVRFDTALNNMSHGLSMFDAGQRLVVCNERYASIYGLPSELRRPGTTLQQLLDHRVANSLYAVDSPHDHARELLSTIGDNLPRIRVVELSDGRSIAVKRQPMADGGWVATHEDITEQRRTEARIAHMAHHDALTDLANRVLLRERLDETLARRPRDEQVAVLCMDLDRFKEVNDTLGHPMGDALLQTVAHRLRGCIRDSDIVARLGGDEFAILQSGVAQPAGAAALARRIIEEISLPYELEGQQVVLGTSVGIAVAPGDGTEPDQLLSHADLALYRAKGDGRGTFRFFEPGMDAAAQIRRRLELDLRTALGTGAFELYYQPLLDLDRNEVSGFEALLRWNHPERGLVAPDAFIPLAEETGLIVPIGEWVLRQACAQAAGWPEQVRVAVNLSAVQFNTANLVELVFSALNSSGLAASRLELEITESALLENSDSAFATLRRLHDMGVRMSLDDFGIGYSSLSYLRRFSFDKIKIDKSFIRDMGGDKQSVAIVQAVIGLGASLEMETVAEGVETRDEFDCLRAFGCTEVQGYYVSRPQPASEIAQMLATIRGKIELAA